MNGNPDLDRERLTSLFDDLSRELEFARTRVQIYVIGGAAMSTAFDRGRTTKDVDARIDAGHGALMKAVERIARKRGLTRNWLNEEATSAIHAAAAETEYAIWQLLAADHTRPRRFVRITGPPRPQPPRADRAPRTAADRPLCRAAVPEPPDATPRAARSHAPDARLADQFVRADTPPRQHGVVAEGVKVMAREEAAYWLSVAIHRRRLVPFCRTLRVMLIGQPAPLLPSTQHACPFRLSPTHLPRRAAQQ